MKHILLISLGIFSMVLLFVIGKPIEILNVNTDRFVNIVITLLYFLVIILLFKMNYKVQNKNIKITFFVLLTFIFVFFVLIGIFNSFLFFSKHPPEWQDLTVYTNNKGEKVISQWRETSGSIYDYRDRKIIKDFGNFRISLDCNIENLKGEWVKHDLKKDTKINVHF